MPKTWLIVGCTSGFGERLVRQVFARGDKVIAAGRDATRRSQALVDLGVTIADLDLAWDHVRIEHVVRGAIEKSGGKIDYLFSVAGYGYVEAFEELSQTRIVESLQVNLHGHVNVTRAVLPFMRAQGYGKIAIMGSEAGWVGLSGFSAYNMAKSALEGFISCLSLEVAPLGIKTLIVEPGGHRTLWGRNCDRDRQPRYAAYDTIRAELDQIPTLIGDSAPGNPDIAVKRMVETLTETGLAAGKPFPPRLPLGKDALIGIRRKCLDTLRLLDDWEDVIVSSTDRPITNPFQAGDSNGAETA